MSIARVLHIESGSGYGGSASGLLNIVPKLAREGFDPVVGYYHKGPYIQAIERLGIPMVHIRPTHIAMDVYTLIRRHRIQLVHDNNELYSHVWGLLAATACGVHRICHMRITRRFTRREHLAKHMIDYFVAISDVGLKLYIEEGVPPDRIRRIYNSIDLTRYTNLPPRRQLRQSMGLDVAGPVVGFVSRVLPMKGHREFLQGAALVLRRRPDVTFAIVGDDITPGGPFMAELRRWVADQRLTERIRFLGWRQDIPEVTSCFDMAVQASKYVEGLGRALLEAMALSIPVVATATGGFTEVVEDGINGFLAPVGDGEALGQTMLRLLEDPARMRQMGERGRQRVESQFNAQVQIQELKRVFLSVLAKPSRRWYPSRPGGPVADVE